MSGINGVGNFLSSEQIRKARLALADKKWNASNQTANSSDEGGGDEGGSGGSGKTLVSYGAKELRQIVDRGGFKDSPDFVAQELGDQALENPVGGDPKEATAAAKAAKEQAAAAAKSFEKYAKQSTTDKIFKAVNSSFSTFGNTISPAGNNEMNAAQIAKDKAAGKNMADGNLLGFHKQKSQLFNQTRNGGGDSNNPGNSPSQPFGSSRR